MTYKSKRHAARAYIRRGGGRSLGGGWFELSAGGCRIQGLDAVARFLISRDRLVVNNDMTADLTSSALHAIDICNARVARLNQDA